MTDESSPAQAGNLTRRVRSILVEPTLEWSRIAAERTSPREVLLRYAVPLAAIGPLSNFIGGQLFGYGAFGFSYRMGIGPALRGLAVGYALSLGFVLVLGALANVIAPRLGGTGDNAQSFKLVAYSATAGWVAGVFGLVPAVSFLSVLGLYSIYLFYTGANAMLKVPESKAPTFTAVTFVAAIILYLLIGSLASAIG